MRTLVGAIGYRNLRDHSAPFAVLERLALESLDVNAELEDVSYNPIALVQWLDEQPPDARFERVIFIASVPRPGRTPGAIASYRWDGVLPSDALIQQAVTEAVTGIISLDNTLIIAGHFGALPASVAIVEIEPVEHEFGCQLSPPVERAVGEAVLRIRDLVGEREPV